MPGGFEKWGEFRYNSLFIADPGRLTSKWTPGQNDLRGEAVK
jgi:hypothetical protein